MRRYLLVLDKDMPAMGADQEPISYLAAKQEQDPCQVIVLSLARTSETKLPAAELLLGAQVGKFPVAPRPDHEVSDDAEQRIERITHALKVIGCQASGIVSDQDLLTAVRSETRGHEYDEVILATGRQDGSRLAHLTGRDPVQRLRRHWGERLTVFPAGSRQGSPH